MAGESQGKPGTELPGSGRERGEWWIRWACSFGHLHREQIGPKALAEKECDRRRTEARRDKFCPRHLVETRPMLFEDAAREYLEWARVNKRSWRSDQDLLKRLTGLNNSPRSG